VESDPQKEMLLGVRVQFNLTSMWVTDGLTCWYTETFLVHSFHSVQFVRTRSSKPERTATMDAQAGSYTFANHLITQAHRHSSLSMCFLFPSFWRFFVDFTFYTYIHPYLSIYERCLFVCCSLRCPRCFLFSVPTNPFPSFYRTQQRVEQSILSHTYYKYSSIGDPSRIPSNLYTQCGGCWVNLWHGGRA
jgi:hypothetical protein